MSNVKASSLTVKDDRTGHAYTIPISRNSVNASDFKRIVAGGEGQNPADLHEHGLRVVDEGYRNTAPVYTAISHLDPDVGSLQYRQYAIQELFRRYGFEDCTHLLVWGKLPSIEERSRLASDFASWMDVPDAVANTVKSLPADAPIMTIIMAGLSAWASLRPELIPVIAATNIYDDLARVDKDVPRTLAALGVVVALAYCHRNGIQLTMPHKDLSYVENLLLMMGFSKKNEKPDQRQVAELSSILLLHAEHGMCNATAAFLHCASTRADPISCLIAALVAIYGPLHGGSNIITFKQIQGVGDVQNIPQLMEDVKNRKQRLFGFGHRIYRATDPRATLLRRLIEDFQKEGRSVPLLDVAVRLDGEVSTNEFFTARGIRANTDLYTVLAYQAMGLPEELVFPFICISRTQGFLAHWREFISQASPNWRPQQIFTGESVKVAEPKL